MKRADMMLSAKEHLEKSGYIVNNLLYPGIAFIIGGAGSGKTSLTMHLAAAVAGGYVFNGFETTQSTVIYIEGEMNEDNTAFYLNFLKRNEEKYKKAATNLYVDFELNCSNLDKLEEHINNLNCKLLVIDSLTTFTIKQYTDQNSPAIAEPLVKLKELAKRRNCCILIVHHANKTNDYSGHNSIKNNCDTMLKLEGKLGEPQTLEIEKDRNGNQNVKYVLQFSSKRNEWIIVNENLDNDCELTKYLMDNTDKQFTVNELVKELKGKLSEHQIRRRLIKLDEEDQLKTEGKNPIKYQLKSCN